jgi:hypothetical protein
MTIALKQLRLLGACSGQVELFKARFGTYVEITEELILEHGKDFDLSWLARKLFTSEQYADYEAKRDALWADYKAKCDALYADYRAKCAPLDADFEAKRAPLWADYRAKRDALWADYEAKRAPLDADYTAKRALAFWHIARI